MEKEEARGGGSVSRGRGARCAKGRHLRFRRPGACGRGARRRGGTSPSSRQTYRRRPHPTSARAEGARARRCPPPSERSARQGAGGGGHERHKAKRRVELVNECRGENVASVVMCRGPKGGSGRGESERAGAWGWAELRASTRSISFAFATASGLRRRLQSKSSMCSSYSTSSRPTARSRSRS